MPCLPIVVMHQPGPPSIVLTREVIYPFGPGGGQMNIMVTPLTYGQMLVLPIVTVLGQMMAVGNRLREGISRIWMYIWNLMTDGQTLAMK